MKVKDILEYGIDDPSPLGNITKDRPIGATKRDAKKYGFDVTKKGVPPLLTDHPGALPPKLKEVMCEEQLIYVSSEPVSFSSLKLSEVSRNNMALYFESIDINDPVPVELLHVTVLASPTRDIINYETLPEGIELDKETFEVGHLGDDGVLVLFFTHEDLEMQWRKAREQGAEPSFDKYIPHMTLSYNSENSDEIDPPDFEIVLGPEIAKDFDNDWEDEYNLDGGESEDSPTSN